MLYVLGPMPKKSASSDMPRLIFHCTSRGLLSVIWLSAMAHFLGMTRAEMKMPAIPTNMTGRTGQKPARHMCPAARRR